MCVGKANVLKYDFDFKIFSSLSTDITFGKLKTQHLWLLHFKSLQWKSESWKIHKCYLQSNPDV